MRDEENMEAKIQAKGLNAPRLTPALIDGKIKSNWFFVPPGTSLTICVLTLANGFYVTGESAAASIENFDPEIGEKIAFRNAREKIWALEGYLLRERLAYTNTPGGGQYLTGQAGHVIHRRTEIVTRNIEHNCWKNKAGDVVPDADVMRSGDIHFRVVHDIDLGDVSGKIIGHDRSEEGAPSFKG